MKGKVVCVALDLKTMAQKVNVFIEKPCKPFELDEIVEIEGVKDNEPGTGKTYEQLRIACMMTQSEKCKRYNLQMCHDCSRVECGDNRNPIVEELIKLREMSKKVDQVFSVKGADSEEDKTTADS